MATSPLSFQGLSSGLQTDALVNAIIQQEGQPVQRLQDKQTANNNRTAALQAMGTNLTALSTSLASLGTTSFSSRTVSSSDTTATYVTATASGAAAGNYDLLVAQVATKGQISPTLSYPGTSTTPSALTFTAASAKTAVGAVGFTTTYDTLAGTVSGTFTVGGKNYTLNGTIAGGSGSLTGAAGTPLEGLTVSVTAAGSGTLNLAGATPTNLAVTDPLATSIFTGATATFAIQGTDGVVKTLTLAGTNNNLYSLRDAINALGTADPAVPGSKGLGVLASVVNTGNGANPYQLVLTAKDTGTGTTNGVVTVADITAGGATNTLGIGAGSVDSLTAPTLITGGLASSGAGVAQDARFSVNGIQLTRKSNTVTDAVDGVSFLLKQGGQTAPTTLSVALDKGGMTTAMQDVVSKFNALVTAYKTASATGGALANDSTARSIITSVRAALGGVPAGLATGATYRSAASVGLTTNQDGTMSLDTTAFQAALDKDPEAVKRVFVSSGQSTNASVGFILSSSKTTTGSVGFNITSYTAGGAISGTLTVNGTGYAVSGNNGVVWGAVGTPLEGLALKVQGTGTGTLNLSRGVGQATKDLVYGMTAPGSGSLATVLSNISAVNVTLAHQITDGQARLARRKTMLQNQFSQMEAAVGQLQALGQSLSGIR